MNPIDRNIKFHFDKAYDGTQIFYPYMIGKGFYIPDVHYTQAIEQFLRSFYILAICTLISFACLAEPLYSLYAGLFFLCAYHFSIKGYTKGLQSCPKNMSIDGMVLMRAKHLNYPTIWSGIALMVFSTPILLVEAITAKSHNILFMISALCGFATMYFFIRIYILKRHLPSSNA